MQQYSGSRATFALLFVVAQVCAVARSDVQRDEPKDNPFSVPVPERPPVIPDSPKPAEKSIPDSPKPEEKSASAVFTRDKCNATVAEVLQRGEYTEEAITPICERRIEAWKRCDFFSEVLSLATSHPDFNQSKFCGNMEEAHFCSGVMDDVLVSYPLSDFAYGECVRAKPKKSPEYCKRFRHIFSDATRSEDLDTIRACYMIEAYGNMSAAELGLDKDKDKDRIIASSSKELDAAGNGNRTRSTPPKVMKFGDSGIVVKPQPLENIGNGNGTFVPRSLGNASMPAPAPAPAPAPVPAPALGPSTTTVRPIIVSPIPAEKAGKAVALLATRSVKLAAAPAALKRRPAWAPHVFLHSSIMP